MYCNAPNPTKQTKDKMLQMCTHAKITYKESHVSKYLGNLNMKTLEVFIWEVIVSVLYLSPMLYFKEMRGR